MLANQLCSGTLGTLFQSADPSIKLNTETKQYIVEQLGNIKLSTSQYIAASIIKYGPYVENMVAMQNFAHRFCQQLFNVINSRPPQNSIKSSSIKIQPSPNNLIYYPSH